MRFEAMPEFFQFCSYFDVVVNFPVEGDSEIPIFGKDRLVAGIQVDDFQSRRGHREKAGLKYALLVLPPVDQCYLSLLNSTLMLGPVFMRVSYTSAQLFVPRGSTFRCYGALASI